MAIQLVEILSKDCFSMRLLEGELRCTYWTFSLFPGPSREAASQALPNKFKEFVPPSGLIHQAFLITTV